MSGLLLELNALNTMAGILIVYFFLFPIHIFKKKNENRFCNNNSKAIINYDHLFLPCSSFFFHLGCLHDRLVWDVRALDAGWE